MPKTLADAKIKLVAVTTKPADWKKPKIAELNAGKDISKSLVKGDYKFGATGSDTVNDAELTSVGNAKTFGAGNFEASVTPFRYFDAAGKAVLTEDVAYQTLGVKGTEVYLYERRGPEWDKPFAAGDVVTALYAVTDHPQPPNDISGYLKATIPLGTQDFAIDVAVTA